MKALLFFCLFFSSVSIGFTQPLNDKLQGHVWLSVTDGESTYFRFDSDNTLRMSLGTPDDLAPAFRYSLNGSTLTIQGLREFLCDTTVKGTYTLSLENNVLRFVLISDPCPGRSFFFVLGDFNIVPPSLSDKLKSQIWQSVRNGETNYLIFRNDVILMGLGRFENLKPTFSYTIDGSSITLNGVEKFLCETTVQGKYNLKLENDKLRFTLVSDACTGRSDYLALADFTISTISSVEETTLNNETILVPNPANNTLRLMSRTQSNHYLTGTISIINALGTEVLTISANEVIDVSSLPIGAYIVRSHGGGNIFTKPLIISR